MRKAFAALLIIGAMGLIMTSCGNKEESSITTEATEEIEWPQCAQDNSVPAPDVDTLVGSIYYDNSDEFYVEVSNMNTDAFKAYVKKCKEAGYTEDYESGDDYYRAENSNGDHISIDVVNTDIVGIHFMISKAYAESMAKLESYAESFAESASETATSAEETEIDTEETTMAAASEETETTAEETTTAAASENQERTDSGSGSDYRKMLDDYESFMNDYVEFMKKYNENKNDPSLLSDYAKYMQKYTELMNEISNIDQSKLSASDLAYYTEVTARVSKKLLELQQ